MLVLAKGALWTDAAIDLQRAISSIDKSFLNEFTAVTVDNLVDKTRLDGSDVNLQKIKLHNDVPQPLCHDYCHDHSLISLGKSETGSETQQPNLVIA
jgi:hypothetical protein